jgi:acyl-CoA synthetase (AMP-forming)/AMP-acid ligase II
MDVPLTIADHLERAVRVFPDRVAVVDEPDQPAAPLEGGSFTYRRLGELAAAQAAALDELGIARGARVGIVSHNSARMMVAFWGVSMWGRVLVPINYRLNTREIGFIVQHSGCEVLLVDPELVDVVGETSATHTFVLGEDDERIYRHGVAPEPWDRDEQTTATINYTSGTTASPKGVQLTHRTLWTNATTFGWHMGVDDRDVYLHTLPLFHVNGWGMPFAMTAMGARHILLRQVDGPEILRRIEQHGVTMLCAAPAVLDAVLKAASDWDGPIPGSGTVRIVAAGAPPPSTTIQAVHEVLGWEFNQIYGLTETAPLLTVNRPIAEYDDLGPREKALALMRAGVPALGVDLRIDTEGEILARGNHALAGYWENPDATARALDGGWFHTGDAGYLDDDGYLVINDRKKDVIISGGENISSIEVEDVLFGHPKVAEAAVVGVPSEKWGETPKALLVLLPGEQATEAEIIAYCREELAHFKCPTSVEFRDALPRTATGKLQKFKMREAYWEGRERRVN